MFARFENLIEAFPAGDKGMPPTGLLAFVMHYTRPILPLLMVSSTLVAVLSVIEIALFAVSGVLVDWMAASDRATFFQDRGTILLVGAAVVLLGFPLLVVAHALLLFQSIFPRFPTRIRWQVHRYLLGQSLSFFQDEFAGRVSQKVMQTSLAVREAVMKFLDVGVYVIVYFVGALVAVGINDVRLTVPLLVWLCGYVWILAHFVPRMQHVSKLQSDARAEMTGRVVDSYANIQTIKLFAHTRDEENYARDAMDVLLMALHRQMRLVTRLVVSLRVLNISLLVAIALALVYGWQQDWITIGGFAVAMGLVMRIRAMSEWIMWEVGDLFEQIGTIEDGVGTIARPTDIVDRRDATELVTGSGEVRFENARFHYGRQTRVIHDFSLTIAPGEKIGLVGRSGAGKSTLVNLLLRFHDLEGGRIAIDGQDIAAVTQESLRRQIGVVTQDTSLLHRSVRENILYGQPRADEAAVREAARLAHADGFIDGLTDPKGRSGYDAHVGERGVKLSGGQRQRIALARVFLKNAPILVLDEATSALDSEIEAEIQESLYRLMQGKTVIAIAHRLSTIAAMDRLIVLDEGRIVESGTHEALLAAGGLYAALWNRQSGGFLDLALERENVA